MAFNIKSYKDAFPPPTPPPPAGSSERESQELTAVLGKKNSAVCSRSHHKYFYGKFCVRRHELLNYRQHFLRGIDV